MKIRTNHNSETIVLNQSIKKQRPSTKLKHTLKHDTPVLRRCFDSVVFNSFVSY